MFLRAAAVAFLVAVALGSEASGQRPVFRGGVDLVTLGVTVLDRRGQLVTDLSAEDFAILEDGAPQTIRFFARGGDAEQLARTRLGLLLDVSGSMERDLDTARTAAIRFLNLLPEARDITLVDFDTEVRLSRYGQADFPRLVERLRSRRLGGWTAFFDALGMYVDSVDGLDGHRILVMYTDGIDTRSALRFSETLALLRASSVTAYAVGFLQNQVAAARAEGRMRLTQLTEVTGGRAFFPTALADLDEAYGQILAEIRHLYHLGYVSTNRTADGAWRRIDVRVKRPDLRVRTRDGYFAPYGHPG